MARKHGFFRPHLGQSFPQVASTTLRDDVPPNLFGLAADFSTGWAWQNGAGGSATAGIASLSVADADDWLTATGDDAQFIAGTYSFSVDVVAQGAGDVGKLATVWIAAYTSDFGTLTEIKVNRALTLSYQRVTATLSAASAALVYHVYPIITGEAGANLYARNPRLEGPAGCRLDAF